MQNTVKNQLFRDILVGSVRSRSHHFHRNRPLGSAIRKISFLLISSSQLFDVVSAQIDLSTDYIRYSFINSCSVQNGQIQQHHVSVSGLLNFSKYTSDLAEKELTLAYGYGRFGELSFSYNDSRRYVNYNSETFVHRYRYGNYIDLWPSDLFFRPVGVITFDFYHYFNPYEDRTVKRTQFLNYRDLSFGGGLKIGKNDRWGALGAFSLLTSRLAAANNAEDPICDKTEKKIIGAVAFKIFDHLWLDGIVLFMFGDCFYKIYTGYNGESYLVPIRLQYEKYNSVGQSYTVTLWNMFMTIGFKGMHPLVDPWKGVQLFDQREFNVSLGYIFKHNKIRFGYRNSDPVYAGNMITIDYELVF